jgi:hypothetical protein
MRRIAIPLAFALVGATVRGAEGGAPPDAGS